MTFAGRLKGGNIYTDLKESVSVAKNSGPGFHDIYFLTSLLRRLTNKSTFGVPNLSHMKLNRP